MKLLPAETELTGNDAVERRIIALITSYLEKIADSADGWDALYRDPEDGRYWELTFPKSHMHGGGPRRLATIPLEQAVSKYQDDSTTFLDLR